MASEAVGSPWMAVSGGRLSEELNQEDRLEPVTSEERAVGRELETSGGEGRLLHYSQTQQHRYWQRVLESRDAWTQAVLLDWMQDDLMGPQLRPKELSGLLQSPPLLGIPEAASVSHLSQVEHFERKAVKLVEVPRY